MTSQESNEIILYELGRGKGTEIAYSGNTWKVRGVLNYKKIPYKTVFLRFPDIKPTLQDKVPPNAAGRYSVPTVRMPDGKYIMDSANIVPELEAMQPSPTLYLDDPMLEKVRELEAEARMAVRPVFWTGVATYLDDESVKWFQSYTGLKSGTVVNVDQAWEKAVPAIKGLADLLKQNKDGPYFRGKEPSYCDFHFLALVTMLKIVKKEELFDRVMAFDDVFKTWFEACMPWIERNSW